MLIKKPSEVPRKQSFQTCSFFPLFSSSPGKQKLDLFFTENKKKSQKNENRRYIFASIFKNDLVVPLIKNKLEIFKGFVSSFGFDEQLRVFLSSSLMCLYFALSVRHHVVFYLFFIHSLVTLFFTLLSFDGADKKELKTQSRTVSVEIDFSHDHLLITFSSFEMGQLSSRSLV